MASEPAQIVKLASGVSEKGRALYAMYEKRFGKPVDIPHNQEPAVDPTPDTRATLELCERLQREWTEWTDIEKAPTKEGTLTLFRCIQDYLNGAEAIIRDLRRLVEVEAELERTRVKLHCYVAAADAEATFANESELQRLRVALKPFADRAESLRQLASDLDSTEARVCGTQPVPVQHLIAAAEALAHREGQ